MRVMRHHNGGIFIIQIVVIAADLWTIICDTLIAFEYTKCKVILIP